MYRKDNRTSTYTITDTNPTVNIGNDLGARGDEALMLRITGGSVAFSYAAGGPRLTLEAGLYMYEKAHPFGGSFWMHRISDNITLDFAIRGEVDG